MTGFAGFTRKFFVPFVPFPRGFTRFSEALTLAANLTGPGIVPQRYYSQAKNLATDNTD